MCFVFKSLSLFLVVIVVVVVFLALESRRPDSATHNMSTAGASQPDRWLAGLGCFYDLNEFSMAAAAAAAFALGREGGAAIAIVLCRARIGVRFCTRSRSRSESQNRGDLPAELSQIESALAGEILSASASEPAAAAGEKVYAYGCCFVEIANRVGAQ